MSVVQGLSDLGQQLAERPAPSINWRRVFLGLFFLPFIAAGVTVRILVHAVQLAGSAFMEGYSPTEPPTKPAEPKVPRYPA